jgi:hypothetical protein
MVLVYLATPADHGERKHSAAILVRTLLSFSAQFVAFCVLFSAGSSRVLLLLFIVTHLDFCDP